MTDEIVVHARGHENVSGQHASTLEVTSDDFLTPAGDCILAIEADTVAADVPQSFVEQCQTETAEITATLEADGHRETVTGRGHPDLSFEGERSMVCRTSDYVDDRTVMVDADAAAGDLDRDLVAVLTEGVEATLTLRVDQG